ncbi:hypothetical protein FRC08_002275 [Ceratobasidium sp. 394]|nr:hypothetical protein FRC08_002275 [Ceratobasidium sp. 394]
MLISSRSFVLRAGIFATTVLPLVTEAASTPVRRQNSSISWFDCPDSNRTQCAFFNVPRDYSNPSGDDTVSIFLRKLPANVSEENRLGSILTNPGASLCVIRFEQPLTFSHDIIQGPGGSGTAFVEEGGVHLSAIMDGRYDIIGFDSRAVNLTGPWTACFDTEAKPLLSGLQLELAGAPYPRSTLDIDRKIVKNINGLFAGHSAACVKNGNRKMLESSGTAFVVQDMERIVEALGEDGINYYGYSYGTILGATFAAMRPNLVKRMVLDGVSNAESYFNDVWQWGRDSMAETHKTFAGFLSTCIEAGPEHCAFAAPPAGSSETQTTDSLRKRLDALFARLAKEPMVIGDSPFAPGLLTASGVQGLLVGALYSPATWSAVMQVLTSVERGNGTDLYTGLYSPYIDIVRQPYNENVFNRSMQRYTTRESIRPILCGDTAATNISVNALTDYFRELGKISPVGEQWAKILGACNGWAFRSSQRYTGPWTVAKGLKKTRFPILFVSLDADPVAPLSSAVKMSKGFGNKSATLLVQQGFGHCSTAHPSLCTSKHVHDYFVDGKVPANGTRCTPEPGFLYPANSTNSKRATLNKRDGELLESLHRLREARSKFDSNILGIY